MHLVKFKFNNSKYQIKSKNLEKGVAFSELECFFVVLRDSEERISVIKS